MRRRAVFLDKDGTLVRNVPYNVDPSLVELVPGAAAALARLRDAGYLLVLVTNQSGIARGHFVESELFGALDRLARELGRHGITFADVLWCPHHPDGVVEELAVRCGCRKPRPGLLLEAAERHDIELGDSWMVGDILDDVEAGQRAGCRAVLVDIGSEDQWVDGPWRRPDAVVRDIEDAADVILDADEESVVRGAVAGPGRRAWRAD